MCYTWLWGGQGCAVPQLPLCGGEGRLSKDFDNNLSKSGLGSHFVSPGQIVPTKGSAQNTRHYVQHAYLMKRVVDDVIEYWVS